MRFVVLSSYSYPLHANCYSLHANSIHYNLLLSTEIFPSEVLVVNKFPQESFEIDTFPCYNGTGIIRVKSIHMDAHKEGLKHEKE